VYAGKREFTRGKVTEKRRGVLIIDRRFLKVHFGDGGKRMKKKGKIGGTEGHGR